ncbi:hypothetical protein B0J17DRAFT_401980 [Rhizoctonia solani]|nr:hypothetical protein B0J17DRAFT_401980 [Rhizoctonia solani]
MLTDGWPLSKRQEWNSRQPVHKLPPELLSYIFVLYHYLGLETYQYGPDTKPVLLPVHTTIPVICRYWRTLAINTAALWTSQYAGNHVPREVTKLVPSRAGSTTLLDIKITITHDMDASNSESDTATAIESYRQAASDCFTLILNNGGVASRWRSLFVDTNVYAAHLVILNLIRSTPMPCLQYLELPSTRVLSQYPEELHAWQEAHNLTSPLATAILPMSNKVTTAPSIRSS